MSDRNEGGSLGGGPRVQTSKCPTDTPLSSSQKGMNDTVEPRTAKEGTIGGGETSSK